jgi:hypothetical protein
MVCKECNFQLSSSFKFCPQCGTKVQPIPATKVKSIPDRFQDVIAEYESFTNTKLSHEQQMRFIEHPSVGQLSVNDSKRRALAAKRVLKPNGQGSFKLDVFEWARAMYDVADPKSSRSARVWITSGGDKYHKERDCKGLIDGQSFAIWKGKETYRPQFVLLSDAAWILGKHPCEVCKPEEW